MNVIFLVVFLYLFSSIIYGIYLWSPSNKLAKIGFFSAIAGLIFHSFKLIELFFSLNLPGIGIINSLFIISWLIGIVYFISQIKFKSSVLGAFILPVIFISALPSLIIPPGIIDTDPTLQNPLILIHIILIFVGEAFFVVSFISAVIYLFQEDKIKSKKISKLLKKLPSLTILDRINHFSLLLGSLFLTIGLAIGFILAKEILADNWRWGAKETLSTATWLVYALLINGRISLGWRGKKSAMGAVIGFIIIFVTFLVGYIIPNW